MSAIKVVVKSQRATLFLLKKVNTVTCTKQTCGRSLAQMEKVVAKTQNLKFHG
jgi:hypothetical protein